MVLYSEQVLAPSIWPFRVRHMFALKASSNTTRSIKNDPKMNPGNLIQKNGESYRNVQLQEHFVCLGSEG